jgi:hypothetical protein
MQLQRVDTVALQKRQTLSSRVLCARFHRQPRDDTNKEFGETRKTAFKGTLYPLICLSGSLLIVLSRAICKNISVRV